MKHCLIITSFIDHIDQLSLDASDFDCIICADAGLMRARELGLTPDYLIGDYDSMPLPQDKAVIQLPTVKDQTDTEAALDLAIKHRFHRITILGGLGGRFDHTMGNIGMLAKSLEKNLKVSLLDGLNLVTMLSPGNYKLARGTYQYLGLIAYSEAVEDLSITGTKYELHHHRLTCDTSLGVSNEITRDYAEISFVKGRLLVICSNDSKT